jgi:protein-S-isoprenylcysteine O-methyltransferase Ste14
VNHRVANTALRTLVWLGAFAWWVYLRKPAGSSFLEIRSGVIGALGLILTATGAGLYIWGALTLSETVPTALAPPGELLMRGPYRYVRNPLYLAAAAIFAGVSALYAPWRSADLLIAGILATGVHLAVVRLEEPVTRKRFGQEYDEYCRRVGRWLPRLTVLRRTN